MKVTWSWLGDWTELPESPEALAMLLAKRGFPVESLERGTSFDPTIVVGKVLEVAPHPNADRLRLCSVDVGSERLSIVCGASNVAAGQHVAVAQIGSRLPDGTKLRKAKIRSVESQGMICSERELGLSQESEGILVLPGAPAIGTPIENVIGSKDTVLDVEITSNRTDCLSVRGLAREIASAVGTPLKAAVPLKAAGRAAMPAVTIENPADCGRYMARVVTGLTVGPSPRWLVERIEAAGFRSISNIVDATNYVLREWGQPIHAFDASKVGGNEIRVRRAVKGESLTLLDGKTVPLHAGVLLIADRERPLALAGIMGGLESGVTAATTSVVLESAWFDPSLTRSAARSLGLETDASIRFGQGVDPVAVADALDATARLLAEIAGGEVADAKVDAWPGRREPKHVRLRRARMARLLGMPVTGVAAAKALETLDIHQRGDWTHEGDDEVGTFEAPPFRLDLEIEEDLIEEVGRVIGYDEVPATLRASAATPSPRPMEVSLGDRIAALARGLGFNQAIGPALVGPIPAEARDGVADGDIWELQNPKSGELKHLRTSLLPGLADIAARNLRHGVPDVRLVELGKVYRALPPPLGSEWVEIGMIVSGVPDPWDRPGSDPDRYLELKGAVESILGALGIDSWRTGSYHESCWASGTGVNWSVVEGRLGRMGELAPALVGRAGLGRPAWAAILDLSVLSQASPPSRRYRDVPRFPASKRDLAVMVRPGTTHETLVESIRAAGGPLLQEVRLFDVYEFRDGDHRGQKSMAFALEFRSLERTLTDREVESAIAAIVEALASKHGAEVRGAAGEARRA